MVKRFVVVALFHFMYRWVHVRARFFSLLLLLLLLFCVVFSFFLLLLFFLLFEFGCVDK